MTTCESGIKHIVTLRGDCEYFSNWKQIRLPDPYVFIVNIVKNACSWAHPFAIIQS